MIVTLIKRERTFTLHLPLTIKGQFWLSDKNNKELTRKVLSIEGLAGKWHIRGYRAVRITDSTGREVRTVEMEPDSFYLVSFGTSEEPAVLFCEEITPGRLNFQKYWINAIDGVSINIGRNPDNAIVYDKKFVSGDHCTLMYHKGHWTIQDNKSGNGTFVNSYAVSSAQVWPGDSIYILGLTIIIGSNFIAINNPNNNVQLNAGIFRQYQPELLDSTGHDDSLDDENDETEFFYRTPRFKRDIEKATFTIDPPPQPQNNDETPVLLTIGPSITMAMMAVTTGSFAVMNAISTGNTRMAIPAMVMSFSMLLGTILWPTLNRRYQKKRNLKKEEERQAKYTQYLEKLERQINEEYVSQDAILRDNSTSIGECVRRVMVKDISLWERSANQNDFLSLRVGIGDQDLLAEIKVPEDKFSLNEDNLLEQAQNVGSSLKKLKNVPVAMSFLENHFTSVIGDRNTCIEFASGLIVQLTAFYGYDDIKTVFIYDETELSEFKYTKWLPHTWSNDKSQRLIARNINELKEVSAYLEKETEARKGIEGAAIKVAPYYVIFAFSRDLALRSEALNQLYSLEQNIGISIISFCDELKNVPKECTAVIQLTGKNGKIFDKNDTSGKSVSFLNDIGYSGNMDEYSTSLANIVLDMSSSSFQLPKMVTFMDMFGVSKVDHLNASVRWKESDATASLQAPVGINTFGDLFYLDLHEKFHGPHGLVAGTTGSGKSEFIITYILSLALSYHPHEVAFILIDYKGGGMAKAFETLPHTAGIITNLDGSAIKRSLVSINSELKYRQAVFNDASKQLGTRIADIYAYQKEYRNGKVQEPIPHLFIISDEFAELKSQQPEFMTELVSTARIGRSLGVHLILATQKPDGVVDDQIWSNSKFKISLKVQDRADSMSMLKRPDAAELVDTGRFYLLVGNNEVFELGQSAWAGANYAPMEATTTNNTCIIDVIDISGRVIQSERPEVAAVKTPDNKKQLDAITEYITQTAAEEKVTTRQLWLPPIEAVITLKDLHRIYPQERTNIYSLNPLLGEIDDPVRQQRMPLTLDFAENGNTVIYGATGGGKVLFIETMTYDLLCTHTAETLNMYMLDFGAETLGVFRNAPQVGDVVFSDEAEKIGNMLKMLRKEVATRKKLFADWGGDHASYCERSGQVVPNILVVINNYTIFREMYPAYEDHIASITQECAKYGMYFVLAATGINGIGFRVTQNCGKYFILQMNDVADYYTVLGRTEGLFPAKFKGRGLLKQDEIYEFQTAHISELENANDDIYQLCNALVEMPQTLQAKRIPILPEAVTLDFFSGEPVNLKRLPIGINKQSLKTEYISIVASLVTIIAAADTAQTVPFTQGLAELLSINGISTVVLDANSLFAPDEGRRYKYINQDMENTVVELFHSVSARKKAYTEEGKRDFEHIVYVIQSFQPLHDLLGEDAADKLQVLLLHGTVDYGISVIISDGAAANRTYAHQQWYRSQCVGSGIWIGDGVANQSILPLSSYGHDVHGEIGSKFGYLVASGKHKQIKILQSGTHKEEEGDE